ncbi:MAG: UDP-N-acetylmuramoyl-L-alanyl-D-glutamate--2,6-diaminopimelate ligase [Desulfovibrio sp.]|nr:UDP-N-acetylmuramoyl-L-alanyl-D-glutamate--2,6-diaminopimelate ligase [Desulfovibrio sp.]
MEGEFDALVERCGRERVEVRVDSRLVRSGDIFVAVPGASQDGAQFIPAAVAAGAGVIVCCPGIPEEAAASEAGCQIIHHNDPREALWRLAEARWHSSKLPIRVLGITGTNGKTTCTYLLEHLFAQAGHIPGVLGTVSYRWPGHSEPAPLTTPDALSVHSMLSNMATAGVDVAVMEVSSHAIDQQRVYGVPFSGVIFTNLTQDHLDYHRDMESYFKVKARLFLELPKSDKAMAINADDAWGRRLLELCPQALSFGLQKTAFRRRHLWGELLSAGTEGCHLRMHFEKRQWELRSPLVGAFNASNLLAVQAVALEMGFDSSVFNALESFTGVCGRLERIDNDQGYNVFVDYAHTPDALENVLKALRSAGFKRIITVFGCGGNRDRTKRPLMGKAVAQWSDVAVLTSDNPRYEKPEAILEDVLPGLREARNVVVDVDRKQATIKALNMIGKNDALLIAGKGHEDYQIVNGAKHHYSDQETVREFFHCV